MKTINKYSSIRVFWKIFRGNNKISEDFHSPNTNVKIFLVGSGDTYYYIPTVNTIVDPGYDVLEIDIPSGKLIEGVYDIKSIWVKNNGRNVLTSIRSGVLAITDSSEEAPVQDEEIKIASYVESFGRDGMTAYELAVMRGITELSEKDWLQGLDLQDGSVTEEKLSSEVVKKLNNKANRASDVTYQSETGIDGKNVEEALNTVGTRLQNLEHPSTAAANLYVAEIVADGSVMSNYEQNEGAMPPLQTGDVVFMTALGKFGYRVNGRRDTTSGYTVYTNPTIVTKDGYKAADYQFVEGETKVFYCGSDKKSYTWSSTGDALVEYERKSSMTLEDLTPTMTNIDNVREEVNIITEEVTTVTDEVQNISDEEDLTRVQQVRNGKTYEVLQLKDREYAEGKGMGYVILREGDFKSQVEGKPNTIFEVRYDFDLKGGEVAMPSNCVLKFDGGKLTNGTIVGDSTRVIGDPVLDVMVNGNWVTNFYANWVDKGSSKYSAIIKSILSVGNPFVLDCDITLDGSSVTLDKLIIEGYNKTIYRTCSFNVKNELNLSNIVFDCDSDLEHVVRVTEKGEVDINNVKIYGNSKAKHGVRTGNLRKCNITSCEVTGVINYGIRIDGEVRGAAIRNCYIHDMGNDVSVNGIRSSAIGLIVGNNDSNCAYTHIENVIVENIQCGYAEGDDSGEAHGIIVYGEHSVVSGCTISNIYTLSNGEDVNSGVDCEGLYTKGDYVNIENNNVIYANGVSSDGAITAKAGNYVRIKGNNVKAKRGRAIVVTESNCTIEGNTIQCEKDATCGFYCYTYNGNAIYNNVIKNNRFECINRTQGVSSIAVGTANGDGIVIENNTIKGFPVFMQCYDGDSRDLSVQAIGNDFEISNIDYIDELDSDKIIYSTYQSVFKYKIINNTFNLIGIRINNIFYGQSGYSNAEFVGNKINLLTYQGEDAVTGVGTDSVGACRFNRAFTGVKIFTKNELFYGEGCTASNVVTLSDGIVDGNLFDGSITKLPTLEGSKLTANQLLSAKTVGDTSSRPKNKVSVGFQYLDTTINKVILWDGTKWIDFMGNEV